MICGWFIIHHGICFYNIMGSDTHTICQSYNIQTALSTPSSTIHCHHSHSVVTELLQSCPCVLPGSTIHSSGVGVVEPTARSLVGEWYRIAVHNLPLWLSPGEGNGCGGLGDYHGDGRSRGGWSWGWKGLRSIAVVRYLKPDVGECITLHVWSTMWFS